MTAETKPAGRFAILFHDHPFPHWDFLLECGEACRTWRLLADPFTQKVVSAEAIADHRLHYLDYSGPVGGDRGTVTQMDAGQYDTLDSSNDWTIVLSGRQLHCKIQWKAELSQWQFGD